MRKAGEISRTAYRSRAALSVNPPSHEGEPYQAPGTMSRFRQLIDSSPDAIVIVDSDGRIRHANFQAASLFGYGPERFHGKPVRALLPQQPLPLSPRAAPCH